MKRTYNIFYFSKLFCEHEIEKDDITAIKITGKFLQSRHGRFLVVQTLILFLKIDVFLL